MNRRGGVLRSVAVVGIGSVIGGALIFVVTRIYADRYDTNDFSAFLIFRLYSTLLIALTSLGLPVSVQRNIAFLGGTPSRAATAAIVGLAIGVASVVVGAGTSMALSRHIAGLLEHPSAAPLWQMFMVLTVAQVLAAMVSLIQIARDRLIESTVVNVLAVSVAPLIAVLVLPRASLAEVVLATAGVTTLCALPSLLEISRWAARHGVRELRQEAALLVRYGVPRGIGNFVELLVTTLLPWAALATGSDLVQAGFIAIGLAFLRPLSLLTVALNRVMIPVSARNVAQGEIAVQSLRVRRVAELSLHVGMFVAFQMAVWGDTLVKIWLGEQYAAAGTVTRVLGLTIAPVLVFESLRGMIDGEEERPINARNLFLSLVPFFVMLAITWALSLGPLGLAFSLFASRLTLAAATLMHVSRTHAIGLGDLHFGEALLVTSGLAGLCLVARLQFPGVEIALLCGAGLASSCLLVGVLATRRVEWASRIVHRLGLLKERR